MGEVEFGKDEELKVKIVDGGEYKEPGGGIRKPSQEEIDEYKIHRIIVMIIFGLVVVILLLLIVILIATTDRCEEMPEEKKLPWYKSGVIYNIYPRSFKDSNGDGTGDFKGIVDKLDYLKGLGVNILYLSSVFKIDKKVDYGYSVIDFKNTNPEYGTLKDFQNLVDSAHGKDMKVIIEFVPSDTSIEHDWFKQSSSGKNKTDWYVWRDNITSPSWSWSKDNASGRFYLHEDGLEDGYKSKANLNWDSNAVKAEMESVLEFWLDKKVDGFRVVSIQRLFGSNPTGEDWNKIHTIVQKWQNYTTKKNPNSILIGSSHPANLKLYGTKEHPELNIVVNFKLVGENSFFAFYTAENFKKVITEYINNLSEGNWPSWALTSWVHSRVGSNVDGKLARSLEALLLTLPGTPIVFYGDEIGMRNVNVTDNPAVDNKAPMQWNSSKNAGFTTKRSTWFGRVGNVSYTNAKDDQLGIKKMFENVIKLRMENAKALLDGPLSNFTVINQGDVLAYTFKDKVPRFAVAINFGNKANTINLNNIGVESGTLKYHTADKEPGKITMDAVKVPAKVLYLFEVTKMK